MVGGGGGGGRISRLRCTRTRLFRNEYYRAPVTSTDEVLGKVPAANGRKFRSKRIALYAPESYVEIDLYRTGGVAACLIANSAVFVFAFHAPDMENTISPGLIVLRTFVTLSVLRTGPELKNFNILFSFFVIVIYTVFSRCPPASLVTIVYDCHNGETAYETKRK